MTPEREASYQSSTARNNTLASLYNEQTKIKMSLSKKKKTAESFINRIIYSGKLFNIAIFVKLCSRNEFKDGELCLVCGKKFGINLFKPKKHW